MLDETSPNSHRLKENFDDTSIMQNLLALATLELA
jgi:hypothetical protein